MQAVGEGEGAVSIVAWAGYIEEGLTDPAYDWVTGFEAESGCDVQVKTAATSDEMVALMNEGGFDLVTASGDASLRLVFGNRVQEINLDRLQKAIDEKRVSADTTITAASLVEGGVLRRSFDGIRLLGEGKDKFNAKLTIEVAGASKSAVEAIEKAGGKVIVLPEIRESVIKAADARRERRAKRAQKNAKPSGKPAEKPAEKPAS